MKTTKQVEIQNRPGYFFSDVTNADDFHPSLLNIHRVSFESDKFIFYGVGYIKYLDSLDSVHVVFNNLKSYLERDGGNKYLFFALTVENYTKLWDEIKEQIKSLTGHKVQYSKDIMKIRFK